MKKIINDKKNIQEKATVKAGGEEHVVYKDKNGSIMASHPDQDKGKYDTVDLTTKSGAKNIREGVQAVKEWHKRNPSLRGLASPQTVKKLFKKKQDVSSMATKGGQKP